MLDFFITETYWIYEFIRDNKLLFIMIHTLLTVSSYLIFSYHEIKLTDLDFFMENVNTFYDFDKRYYDFNKQFFSFLAPLAIYIIALSFIQRFDSYRFLKRYG